MYLVGVNEPRTCIGVVVPRMCMKIYLIDELYLDGVDVLGTVGLQ
jgi:hypothetical protein